MTVKFSELDAETQALAKADWSTQDPLVPLPGYFPDTPESWMQLHDAYCARAARGDVDLLFIGASILQAWVSGDQFPLWNRLYSPLKAANFGIGGDRTQQVLWRIENGTLDGISPKVIVLMVGLNNLWEPGHGVARAAQGVGLILDAIFARLPMTKVLIIGLFPAGQFPSDPMRARIAEFNQRCGEYADGDRIRFLDFGHRFLQPDGSISAETMPDFSHPLYPGYEIWAEEMGPGLVELIRG